MKKNKNLLAYILIFSLLVISIFGVLRLTLRFTQPAQSQPAFYKVYEDTYVRVSISYMNRNLVSNDGTTFVSIRGQSSNDILLIVENLRQDGLIFTPTPTVTIINSKGQVVRGLSPFVSVAGVASPQDSTYVSLTNPVPSPNTKTGKYTYVIDMQYQHIFYDRVSVAEDISITINSEVRPQRTLMEMYNLAKRVFPYVSLILLVVILVVGRKKR